MTTTQSKDAILVDGIGIITGITNPTIQKVVAEYISGSRTQRKKIARDLEGFCWLAQSEIEKGDTFGVEYYMRRFAQTVFTNLNGEKVTTVIIEECQGLAVMAIHTYKAA